MIKTTIFLLLASFVLFFGCKNASKSVDTPMVYQMSDEEYIDQGLDISSSTFLALSGALKKSIKAGGLENALSYCNLNALALTDSLSNFYDVEIKRTSLKQRNPKNRPTADEVEILNQYEEAKKSGEPLMAMVNEVSGVKKFYAPILVHDVCLKCHGLTTDISIYDSILKHYPDDLATGYAMGDLRGMWSVTFRK